MIYPAWVRLVFVTILTFATATVAYRAGRQREAEARAHPAPGVVVGVDSIPMPDAGAPFLQGAGVVKSSCTYDWRHDLSRTECLDRRRREHDCDVICPGECAPWERPRGELDTP